MRRALAYYEDTVLVAPGERVGVLIKSSELGTWAFGDEGMFGMVTALIVHE